MANTRDSLSACLYTDDANAGYRVDLTAAVKAAGGFQSATAGLPGLPKHARMRHVGAKDPTTGKRASIPQAFHNSGLYQDGGQVQFDGKTYTVTGRIGEKFRL